MSCETKISGIGIGLFGEQLSGSAVYIIDTQKVGSYLANISYTTNDYDPLSSSITCKYSWSDYLCEFERMEAYQFITMADKSEAIGVSGRYCYFFFEIKRNDTDVISPRIYDIKLDFEFDVPQYQHRMIYKMKTDIFGLEYSLLKDDLDLDHYNYKFVDGKIVVKRIGGELTPLSSFIPKEFVKYKNYENKGKYPNLYGQMASGIRDFEVFYDVLMFITEKYIVIEKGLYDYDTISFDVDSTIFKVINLDEINSLYSDVWFFEKNNEVYIFLIQEIKNTPKISLQPICYKLNILSGKLEKVLIENTESINDLGNLNISKYEVPVLTYDSMNSMFNMGMVFYDKDDKYHILSMDIKKYLTKLEIGKIEVISPVDYTNV